MSSRINHVSVNARDLKESVDFYVDLLGAELIATPNFGLPVQWLALGRTQLHLFEKDIRPTSHHHLGITVDDLEPGNLVEIDLAGKDRLPEDLRAQVKPLWDFNPQNDEQMSARLFVPE